MNIPRACSPPSPAAMRPSSTLPNTTDSRPDHAPSRRASPRCMMLAGLTPSDRAWARRRWLRPGARVIRASSMAWPATSWTPKARVGASISASMAPKNASWAWSSWARRLLASRSRNGTGGGRRSLSPARYAWISRRTMSRPVWSMTV
ncbi:hypothetical protein WR25_13898 [Diploscapter pachys]|uniref:Uncharacterized protein n=1 Tax=Diploscapter pachys TaxID=2018661 RepID=A0A2A2M474_9BILA|nr:hypothetical protein WR25_13898 [Diploscapter pachys]